MSYPIKPSGNDIVSESNIFAVSGSKIPMSASEILNGYSNKNESATPLTSEPDAHRFNSFIYQMHNTVVWLIGYVEALFANKLGLSGGTMTGAINMGNAKITNLADATNAQDAMNLQTAQGLLAGVQAGMLGEVKYLSYPTIPDFSSYGYEVVEADGRAISRTTYSTLYSLFGTTFGDGDGSTTFNIPDCRGVVIRGWDNGRGLDSGHAFGQYQADELKAHTHTLSGGGGDETGPYPDTTAQIITQTISTSSTGGTETRMKNISLYPVIRIK